MKKLIILSLLLLIGCANSPESTPAQPTTDVPDVVAETPQDEPEAANDTYEAPDDLALAAREAFIEHFSGSGYI